MNTQDKKTRDRIIKERKKRLIKAHKKSYLSKIFNKTTAVAAFTFVSSMFSSNAPKTFASDRHESSTAVSTFVNKFSPLNFSRFAGEVELDKKSSLETLMLEQGVSPEITTELKEAFSSIANLEEISGDNFNYEIVQNNQDNKIARATIKYKLKTTTKKSNLPKTKNDREITVYGYTDKDGEYKYYTKDGAKIESGLSLPLDDKYIDISSPFDPKRFHPVKKKIQPHEGVDFRAVKGTPIRATADGIAKFVGVKAGYGNNIEIDHGENTNNEKIETGYGHLSSFKVKKGQQIKKGDIIGYVGNTGTSTGDSKGGFHLHYEVRINGVAVDPLGEQSEQITFYDKNDDKRFKMTIAGINFVSEKLASETNFVAVSVLSSKPVVFEDLDVERKIIQDKQRIVKEKLSVVNGKTTTKQNKNRQTVQSKQKNVSYKNYKSNISRG